MSDGKEKPGVLIYFDIREPLEFLDMEQRGELFTAILDYAADGLAPVFDNKLLSMAWAIVKRGIDRDDVQYRTTISRRKYAAYCRYEKEAGRTPLTFDEWNMHEDEGTCMQVHADASTRMPTTTTTTTTTQLQPNTTTTTTTTTTPTNKESTPAEPAPSPKTRKFVKPSLEEVREYIQANNYQVDPDRFHAYYESCGWMVKGRSMKDWKAAIRYWATSDKKVPASSEAQRKGNYFIPHMTTTSWDEYEASSGAEDTTDEEDDALMAMMKGGKD